MRLRSVPVAPGWRQTFRPLDVRRLASAGRHHAASGSGVGGSKRSIACAHAAQDSSNDRPKNSCMRAQLSTSTSNSRTISRCSALAVRQGREFRGVHRLQTPDKTFAQADDPLPELRRFALVDDERAPQRQPTLAGTPPLLDLGADAGLPVAVGIARWRQRRDLDHRVVDRRHLQAVDVGKTFEHRTHGIAGALGDLGSRRHLRRLLARQGQVGLDDQLPGTLASQAAAVDLGGLGGGPFGQGCFSPNYLMNHRIPRRAPERQATGGVGGSMRSMA